MIDLTYINAYFVKRMFTDAWDSADSALKTKAIEHATRIINNLPFVGTVVTVGQAEAFPRLLNENTITLPTEIKDACCELVLALLNDRDPEMEYDGLSISSQGFSSARMTQDISAKPEHLVYGVPSITAWRLLKPYLVDVNSVSVERI